MCECVSELYQFFVDVVVVSVISAGIRKIHVGGRALPGLAEPVRPRTPTLSPDDSNEEAVQRLRLALVLEQRRNEGRHADTSLDLASEKLEYIADLVRTRRLLPLHSVCASLTGCAVLCCAVLHSVFVPCFRPGRRRTPPTSPT